MRQTGVAQRNLYLGLFSNKDPILRTFCMVSLFDPKCTKLTINWGILDKWAPFLDSLNEAFEAFGA